MAYTEKGIGLCRVKRKYSMGDTRPASTSEALLGIQAKLLEECGELVKAPKDVSEYADVLQVLNDMATLNRVDWLDVVNEACRKNSERGGFTNDKLQALLWSPHYEEPSNG